MEKTGDNTVTYHYDANGNLLKQSAGTDTIYTYDVYNRLTAYQQGDKKESYTYDAESVRRSKTSGGETIYFVSDTSGSLSQTLAETDGKGKVKAEYTRADSLTAQVREGKVSYYLYDGHGDVRGLLNTEGKVTDTYRYNAYGELIAQTGNTENHYLYTGEYYDAASNLYYLRARYMNPSTGNFLTMDTYEGSIYDPDTLHKYMYANGNPVMYTDPTGNSAFGEFVASSICSIMNNMYEINLMGVLSGLTNAMVTGLLGGSDTDITKAFFEGYICGVIVGIAMLLVAAAVTEALLLAKFYAINATAGAALSVGATIHAITTKNKKAAIIFGTLAVISIFNMALVYNNYYNVWLIGEKGVAAFSTPDFDTANNMGKGNVEPRIFTSDDPLVGELATEIDQQIPGRVQGVNTDIFREDGTKLTDLDIELDTIVIQVKSGGANGIMGQIIKSEQNTGKIAIGYAPDAKPSILREAERNGIKIFTNIDDLIKFISEN